MVHTTLMHTSLLRLMQLCSQTLPVGAYAYSQAQEYAIATGWVSDAASAEEWISGVYRAGFGRLDLPALVLAHAAADHEDWDRLEEIDEYLRASRETRELLLEDMEMGRALRRLLNTLDVKHGFSQAPSFVSQFACAGVSWGIALQDLMMGFSYSWLENQVMVASKSVPLGQSESQKMLYRLGEAVPGVVTDALALASEPDFGASLHGLAILSARHETMEARLYRS